MLNLPPLNTLVPSRLDTTITDFRARIDQVAQEAVTGRRGDLVTHLKGNVGRAMLSQQALDNLETEKNHLNLRNARLSLTQQSLSFVKDATEGLGPQMLSAIGAGDEQAQTILSDEARTRLDQTLTTLNTRQGSRYLFAGDATTTPPLPDTARLMDAITTLATNAATIDDLTAAFNTFFDDPNGDWQTGLFAGTSQSSDPDGIVAINPAITDVIKNLAALALTTADLPAATQDIAKDLRSDAALGLTQSTTAMTDLMSQVGLNQSQIDDRLTTLGREEIILSTAFNNLTGRDQYEAVTELEQLETNLEAAYLVTTRLSNLTLLNFIK
ncbi:MAG: flagellin [Henriciella sp.]|jgi:flagellar hook-associated protein 3 FlgL